MKLVAFLLVALVPAAAFGDMSSSRLRVLADSTVKVEVADGSGSGVVVGKGLVLTCAHVVGIAGTLVNVRVHLDTGHVEVFSGTVARTNAAADLALLSIPDLKLLPLKVARADASDFSTVWSISSPLGKERTVSVYTLNKAGDDAGHWRLTGSSTMPGSSGGAVVDEHGEIQCLVKSLWVPGVMGECVARSSIADFFPAP